jgi:4-amino-4-deoxy-L-arabinose transferase-like glycosyltransferase
MAAGQVAGLQHSDRSRLKTKVAVPGHVWVLCGIVLLGAGLRFWHLASLPPGLFYDEAINGVDARMVLSGAGLPLYFAANNGREPLFIYLQTLSVALLGYRPFALRLVSAIIGTLTIPAVYFCAHAILTRPEQSESAGTGSAGGPSDDLVVKWLPLIAAAGIAVSYWSLSLSRLGLRAVMLPLTSALALGYFWRAWHGKRYRLYAWAGVWFGLGLYTYTAARVLLLAPFVFVLSEGVLALARRRADAQERSRAVGRRRLMGLVAAGTACLLVAIPLGVAAWQDPNSVLGRIGQVSILAPPPQGEAPAPPIERLARNALLVARNFYDRGDMNARHNLPGRPVNDVLLAVLFTAGCLAYLWRIRQPRARLLLIWLVVMLLPTLLSAEAPHSLRGSGALPPLALLYAAGAEAIAGWLPSSRLRLYAAPALLGLMIVFSGWSTARDYFVRWAALPQLGDDFSLRYELAAEEAARQLAGGFSGGAAASPSLLIPYDLFMQPQVDFVLGTAEIGTTLPVTAPLGAAFLLPSGFDLPGGFDAQEPMFLLRAGPHGPQATLLAALNPAEVAALRTEADSGQASRAMQASNHHDGWPRLLTGRVPDGVTISARPIAVPLDIAFENGLRLAGYELQPPQDTTPGQAPAARLTTFWRCNSGADPRRLREADVFLHLTLSGAVWETSNHSLPAAYLLAWQRPCSLLIDTRLVPMPAGMPAGKVYFETGLYQPLDVDARVPIINPQGQVPPDQVDIAAFMLNGQPPAVDLAGFQTIGASLGGRLELAAWRTTTPQPGTLRVELAWRCLDRTGANYTAFVHLIDAAGRKVAQYDRPPGDPTNPTALWAPGEMVSSTFDLPLPADWQPAGQRLRVGLYLPSTGQQVPVTDLPAGSAATNGGSFLLLPLGSTH